MVESVAETIIVSESTLNSRHLMLTFYDWLQEMRTMTSPSSMTPTASTREGILPTEITQRFEGEEDD